MNEGERQLEAYLTDVRRRLGGLPEAERDDIVAELRSHVRDSAGDTLVASAVTGALDRLGPAEILASQYRTQSALEVAGRSRAPGKVVRGLARVAGAGMAGFSALVACGLGYALSACFVVAALHKPLAPGRVGLWRIGADAFSLALGFGPPPAGEEVLGWWIVPIGLLAGAGGLWLTTRLGRACARRLRRSPLPAVH